MAPYSPPPSIRPPPSPSPAPQSSATPLIIGLVVVLLGLIVLGGFFAYGVYRYASRARTAEHGTVATGSDSAELPAIKRRVPHHPVSVLEGCSPADVDKVVRGIGDAIDIGAPLYNHGNFAGCYHLYEGAASDIERQLPSTCQGPTEALRAGRRRAAEQSSPSASAWAMRDAFDGLLDVAERSDSKAR